MKALLLVGAGGFIGSVARYLMSGMVLRMTGMTGFPVGTLAVNVIGCFAIGVLAGAVGRNGAVSHDARLFLMTGLLGGFTTFSAFGLETMLLIQRREWVFASSNIALSVVLGLIAVWLGLLVMGQRV